MKLHNFLTEGSNDSYYAYHDAAKKWAEDTGKPEREFARAGVDVQDKYIEPEMKKYGLVPDKYMGKGVTSYRREGIEEGEERSIIQDAVVDHLIDTFGGQNWMIFADTREQLEAKMYDEIETLDVDEVVDSSMEVGGQPIGNFASGRVLDVIDSSSAIESAMQHVEGLDEGKSPHKKGSAKYKKQMAAMHAEDVNDSGMIGKPDSYYDEEERKEAYNQLQDALDQCNGVEAEYVKDGICPECAGSSYIDGDYDNEEDSCYGWGNYGCDEGELEYENDTVSWKQIMDHDKKQAEKSNRGPAPDKETVMKVLPRLHDDYVKSGRFNAMELPGILRQMYPELGKREAAGYTAEFFKTFKEQAELQRLAGMEESVPYSKSTEKDLADKMFKAAAEKQRKEKDAEYNKKQKVKEDDSGEAMVAKMLAKALGDENRWTDMSAPELHAELESENSYLADMIKYLAKMLYDVKLQETGLPESEDQFFFVTVGSGRDSMVVKTKAPNRREAIKKNKENYPGQPVRIKPEENPHLDERAYKDVGVADVVKDQRGKEFKFDKNTKKFKSQDGEEADVSTKLGKDLMRLRKNHMKRTSPSYPKKHKVMASIEEAYGDAHEITLEDHEDFNDVFGVLGYSLCEQDTFEAEYQGRKVKLNKPMQGDVKKFKVYVKDPKTGNVKKVNFGHGGSSAKGKTMKIRKSNPKARKSFRARHNCDNPGPKTKARYWSCRKW